MTALIGMIFFSLKRMYYHLNYAVPHFIAYKMGYPPYFGRTLLQGYPIQWRYVILYGVVVLFLTTALVLVLQDIANKER